MIRTGLPKLAGQIVADLGRDGTNLGKHDAEEVVLIRRHEFDTLYRLSGVAR